MISERNRSTKEVTTPSPRTFHEFFTLRSVAMDGASLKTCSAYRAKNRSRPASILVRKLVLVPDRTCETASRLVPQEAQNFRSFKLSLPHVGQNIGSPRCLGAQASPLASSPPRRKMQAGTPALPGIVRPIIQVIKSVARAIQRGRRANRNSPIRALSRAPAVIV